MGDAILRIPRDARVRAYRAWDTYDGVVSATSKSQPSCQSSFIYVSASNAKTAFMRGMICNAALFIILFREK